MLKLRYGNTNTYFINGLLIDTDMPGTMGEFYKELKRNSLTVKDIRYVLATHYHPDHIGLIGKLMAMGVKLVVMDNQLDYVHSSDAILNREKNSCFLPIDETRAVVVECEKSREFLASIGILGQIVRLSSHSADSVAVVLDDGDCFAGDLEPFQFVDSYGENSLLKSDWNLIKALHPKTVHFGHAIDFHCWICFPEK